MQTDVETVSPKMGLVDLERQFLMLGMSGFPVIEQGKLVGIVSRSDVVRLLSVEQTTAEQLSDFYRTFEDSARARSAAAESTAVGATVGARAVGLTVRDAMIRGVVSVDGDQPLSEVARLMLDGHIHRLPVLRDGQLIGLVSTLDIVRLFAEGRIVEAQPDDASGLRLLGPNSTAGDRLAEIRATLEERLDRLIHRTAAIEKDLRAARHPDSEERATERENDEVLERLGASERRHLAQIRAALARIEAGTYDTCERCGNRVGQGRQAALPETTRCRACA
jgi:CBS domain-containing protein/RNA polymerase-binding transcription factor DksA